MVDKTKPYWQGFQSPQDYWAAQWGKLYANYKSIEDKIYGTNGIAQDGKVQDTAQYTKLSNELLQAQTALINSYRDGVSKGVTEAQSLDTSIPVINAKSVQDLVTSAGELAAKVMDNSKVGSSEYSAGKSVYDSANTNLQSAQSLAQQQTQAEKKKQAATTLASTQAELPKLQEQKQRALDKGQDTTEIQKKIDAAQKAITDQGGTISGATNPTGNQAVGSLNADQTAAFKAAVAKDTTPVSTSKSDSNATFGTSSTANVNPVYTTKNGILQQNGKPFTGQYENKYYNAGKPETPDQVKQDFYKKYATSAALLASVPELNQKLTQAIAGNWSKDKWQQEYEASTWFQTHGSAYVTEEQDRLTQPGKYAENYNNLLDQMTLQARQMGIDISGFGGHISSDQAKAMDPNANPIAKLLQNYYNSAVPADILGTYIAKAGKLALGEGGAAQGTLATTATELRNYASQMGVASQFLSPSWSNASGQQTTGQDYFTSAALAAEQGLTTADSIKANMQQVAMNIYKPFAQQIKDGFSVADLAQPYTSTVANLLEVPPASIDLGSSTGNGAMVSKALQGDGTTPMNLDAFTTQVKQRPEWLNTTNARNSLMDTATSLLRNFGMVVGS